MSPAPGSQEVNTHGQKLFFWVWQRYLKKYWLLMAVALGFMSIESGMTAGFSVMMQPLFDEVFATQDQGALVRVGLIVLGLFTFRGLSSIVHKVVLNRAAQMSMADIRQDMLEHLMKLEIGYHADKGPGLLIQRVEGDVGAIAKVWSTLITSAGRDMLTFVSLLWVALWTDWQWTLIALAGVPLMIAPSVFVQRYIRRNARVLRDVAAAQSTRLNEVFHGIAPVKLNQLETWQAKRYRKLARQRILGETRSVAGQAMLPALIDIMSGLGFFGILFFAGTAIQNGGKTLGEFMTFFTAIGMMFEPLRRLSAISGAWQMAAASIERIVEIMHTEPALKDPERPSARPEGLPGIVLEDVRLSYGETEVLRGLSFTAEPGKTTALVGASGAGKSTVFHLLTRMIDPASGRVTIGGVETRALTLKDLRGMISTVSQEALLFDEALRDNIVLDRKVDENALHGALEAAHVSDFLPRLERGLDSRVGPRGSNLSGGQRQRVAIARALLRDTPVLLLDEATSALDTQSEAIVQAALEQLTVGRTTLVIAHRLSTVRNADKIVVMDAGRVVEQGSHEELLAKGGTYASLYTMQFGEEADDDQAQA
ncbi:ABC transporter ATP-binding protein [Sagittula salina]|uniref:ABC transporter ATP-binding protein n=1 Tax=Sagittula salina TaxID=2820268 RepID=A0A940MQZ5_9RHOB|nr:ABC transporter ATP-binding protein [Sagittula salina]MBP0483382.1 ABC transporter ATP-binding protein [Sagittula salina]